MPRSVFTQRMMMAYWLAPKVKQVMVPG